VIRLAPAEALVVIVMIIAFVILRKRRIETRASKVGELEQENAELRELVTGLYGDALVAAKYESFGELVVGKIRQSKSFKDDPRFKEI
jgi:hypothetical protein